MMYVVHDKFMIELIWSFRTLLINLSYWFEHWTCEF